MIRSIRFQLHLAGCCSACGGTGTSGDSAVPGGLCWDCFATGHPHMPTRFQAWHERRSYRVALRTFLFYAEVDHLNFEHEQKIAALDAALIHI